MWKNCGKIQTGCCFQEPSRSELERRWGKYSCIFALFHLLNFRCVTFIKQPFWCIIGIQKPIFRKYKFWHVYTPVKLSPWPRWSNHLSPPKFPLLASSSPSPSPGQPLVCFLSPQIYLYLVEFCVEGIIQHVLFFCLCPFTQPNFEIHSRCCVYD